MSEENLDEELPNILYSENYPDNPEDEKGFLWPCEKEEQLNQAEELLKQSSIDNHIDLLTKEINEKKQITINKNQPIESSNLQDRVDLLTNQLKESTEFLKAKSLMIDEINLLCSILTFKIYEMQHEHKTKVDALKAEKETILLSKLDENLVPLEMLNLDKITREYESKHMGDSKIYEHQKESLQRDYENTVEEMDQQLNDMGECIGLLQDELEKFNEFDKDTQPLLIEYVIRSTLEEYKKKQSYFAKCQLYGWKTLAGDENVISQLNQRGLAVTKSGHILTSEGNKLTYDEAEKQKLLHGLNFRSKLLDTVNTNINEDIVSVVESSDSKEESEKESLESHLSSEDVHYLKQTLGTPLTLALAEITAKQPRDPIHYLGHWLFKYRYNQELDQTQKQEFDNLMDERNRVLREKLHKLYEEEAKLFIFEMINKAENEAIKHELERILQEGNFNEEEGENSANEYAELKKLLNMIQTPGV